MQTLKKKGLTALIATILMFSMVLVAMPITPVSAQLSEVWVDDDALEEWYADPTHFKTVQEGIDAVAEGGTIHVAAGTYDEWLRINKPLTLKGANAGIHPAVGTHPTETVGTRGPETILSNTGRKVVRLQADDITIDGFKFLSPCEAICAGGDADNFHLTNCIFEGEWIEGEGVVLFDANSHKDMLIDFNLFQTGKRILYFGGAGVYDRLNIAYNKFNGLGASVFWAAETPLVDGIIEGNEVDGTIDGVPGVGCGSINMGKAGNIIIRNNWFHDIKFIGLQVGIIGGSITGNKFERITPDQDGVAAIKLWGGEWGTPVSTDVTIESNIIVYNDVSEEYTTHGIILGPPEDGTGIDGSTIHIHNNNFIDGGKTATAFAIIHKGQPDTVVDATLNWWGDVTGPAPGAVSENVDYIPWLDAPYPEGAPIEVEPPVIVYAEILYPVGFNAARPGHFEKRERVIDIGDGTTTTFSGRVRGPIVPGSVVIKVTGQIIRDDGEGGLVGDGTGTIDYDTGEFEVTFGTAPADGEEIVIIYAYPEGEPVIIVAIVTDNVAVAWVEVSGDPFGTLTMGVEPEMPVVYFVDTVVPPHTDPGTYELTITAGDYEGLEDEYTVELNVVYALTAYNVWLADGWNLISLPLVPEDPSTSAVLEGVSVFGLKLWQVLAELGYIDVADLKAMMPEVEVVWSYEARRRGRGRWTYYDVEAEYGRLRYMRDGLGYWMKVSAPEEGESMAVLTVHGYEIAPGPTTPPSYTVYDGWNLIGFKSTHGMPVCEYLEGIEYVRVYGYSAWAQCFYQLRDDDGMELGMGYWVYATEQGTVVP